MHEFDFADLGLFAGGAAYGDQCCCALDAKKVAIRDPSTAPLPRLFQKRTGAGVITSTGQRQSQIASSPERNRVLGKARLRGRDGVSVFSQQTQYVGRRVFRNVERLFFEADVGEAQGQCIP